MSGCSGVLVVAHRSCNLHNQNFVFAVLAPFPQMRSGDRKLFNTFKEIVKGHSLNKRTK
jgi:hypothetical protein